MIVEVSGMVQNDQRELHKGEVKTLNNDYVRSNEQLQQQVRIKHKRKIFLRRRLAVYFVVAAIVFFALGDYLLHQKSRLAEKEAELLATQQTLQDAKDQQEMLELQISKLEDDEYIAKLARKEYFLSEEGEIIFTIPEKSNNKENNTDE